MKKRKFFRNHWGRSFWLLHCPPAMPLSQMFDKVFGMIKNDMYAIKLQEKERELSVLDMTTVATQWGQVLESWDKSTVKRV